VTAGASAATADWLAPSAWPPPLAAGDVHAWRIGLAASAAELSQLESLLTAAERARAARFHFERDARRWTAARAALRALLAGYTGAAPSAIELETGPHGKPRLRGAARDLRFNLSHSGELALCAIALGREVGIDVEEVRADRAGDDIARRFFAPAEVAALAALPAAARVEAFFACWTRKEAYVKARGAGLALGLDRFEVSLAPGSAAALLATHDEPAELERWQLSALDPGPGYAAALVVEGRAAVRCWQWPGVAAGAGVGEPGRAG
jgi:4'-phosphopantetheinyl transferase